MKRVDNPLTALYNAAQLRTDTWARVVELARALQSVDSHDMQRELAQDFDRLRPLEGYWAFPGKHLFRELARLREHRQYGALASQAAAILRLLMSDAYRSRDLSIFQQRTGGGRLALADGLTRGLRAEKRLYFEVLVVENMPAEDEAALRNGLIEMRRDTDEFIYDVVVVPSFEDAVVAVQFNYNVQSVVIRYNFPYRSTNKGTLLQQAYGVGDVQGAGALALGTAIHNVRPELDIFLVTDEPVENVAGLVSSCFRRVFYRQEDHLELHLSILKGISERYATPFFTALREYSHKPTGVFHALPISRGKSITKSHWIQDVGRFYGTNIFLAETSATGGGLDSLLQPTGPLKQAQRQAARAFGARHTYFVTNGTSTANKIVMQALVRPGDIVLIDRDCHKSHHYGLMISGARPIYMDAYPLSDYSMYGGVPLDEIKRHLYALRDAGKLDRVRMVLLTNITFDGITYHTERVMHEILAIKPDMIFLWDEAWFAYGAFNPLTRPRTAMAAARRLYQRYCSEAYRAAHDGSGPHPDEVEVRVYVTQSTHKTLTALRQGSMIHVYDHFFEQRVADAFHEAYMTHTSTSPNYQILASLDVGRRQVELEGYELVQKSLELSMLLRERISHHPLLSRYFSVLSASDMVPQRYRPSGLLNYRDGNAGWQDMQRAWDSDEFTLDPTRVTLHVGRTGMDGDTFKNYLIDHHDIQINKTSRNTVLFMVHIGTTRGTIAYLIDVLTHIARDLEDQNAHMDATERRLLDARVASLTRDLPPLPNFSRFHPAFLEGITPDGDLRKAFFMAYDSSKLESLKLGGEIEEAMRSGRQPVSATFVIPYPPGFPVLVPGQVISSEILDFLKALDVKEIHGYKPAHGLLVFREDALAPPETKEISLQPLRHSLKADAVE